MINLLVQRQILYYKVSNKTYLKTITEWPFDELLQYDFLSILNF